ncbi:hypothetical protein KJ633_05000 [bacterium]|nr:hypothetical protein [bacterium]MBU3955800.1 hypothetical protein [bacterium]MBU4134754.1 hypothetical protein [bacterium]
MMNKKIAAAAMTVFLTGSILHADINTGLDIRGRAFSSDNPSGGDGKCSYFEQRTRFYFEGLMQKDVTGKISLQNNGIWGRDSEEELFLDRAYISAGHIFGLPLGASIGRQGCKLGDGLLLNDEKTGLSGIKLNASLPWGFTGEGAAFKLIEASSASFAGSEADRDIYFVSLSRNAFGGNASLTYFSDFNKTLSSSTKLSLLDLRYESPETKEIQWLFEYAQSAGSDVKTSALLARVTALGNIYKFGKGRAFVLFANGEDNFTSGATFVNEEKNFGEYYMKNRENGRSNTLNNLRIIGTGFKSTPFAKPVNFLFNYFSYNLVAGNAAGLKELGKEMDMGLEYAPTQNLGFRLIYSSFSQGEALSDTGGKIKQFLFETNLNF